MTAETFDEYIVKTFKMYARDNGIDLQQLAYDALKTGKRDVVCERNFQRKLKGYSKDFEKAIGQYMSYEIEYAIRSIELGDYIDMDEYFDDEGVAYNSKTKKSSGKKASTPRSVNKPAKPRGKAAPASKSPKLRYFKPGMDPDDMAEVIAEELTRCGLDKEYDSNWDVFDDCYWYMSTGERKDFVEWANEVRPKCPKAAAMIEEAIAIFDDDGSFEAQADLYKKLGTMSSPASGGRKVPKGRSSTGKAGTKTAPKSNAPKGKAPKKTTAPKKGMGARK